MTITQEQIKAAYQQTFDEQSRHWSDETWEIIRHCLAAMSDPNWVLVPKDITNTMLVSMGIWIENPDKVHKIKAMGVYRKLLSAAPKWGE